MKECSHDEIERHQDESFKPIGSSIGNCPIDSNTACTHELIRKTAGAAKSDKIHSHRNEQNDCLEDVEKQIQGLPNNPPEKDEERDNKEGDLYGRSNSNCHGEI